MIFEGKAVFVILRPGQQMELLPSNMNGFYNLKVKKMAARVVSCWY